MSGGNELNAPNTLDGCADESSGSYLNDESNERVIVESNSGGFITEGGLVRVTANVFVWGMNSDYADFYYTADAYQVDWQYIGTVSPPDDGAQEVSLSYTVPRGASTQAVRVNFRYQGSDGTCTR
jgi:hypothetical protein